jgi:hypothetical protein
MGFEPTLIILTLVILTLVIRPVRGSQEQMSVMMSVIVQMTHVARMAVG